MVLGERLVLEDPHQGVDGNGGVEVLQAGATAHRHKELTGRVTTSWKCMKHIIRRSIMEACVQGKHTCTFSESSKVQSR